MFDIVDFYPSISENLLSLALAYAKQFVAIPDCDADIILHARQSLLFGANRTWAKKNRDGLFDVTMGSFDGAEACELVGAFLLGKLEQHFSSGNRWIEIHYIEHHERVASLLLDCAEPVYDGGCVFP